MHPHLTTRRSFLFSAVPWLIPAGANAQPPAPRPPAAPGVFLPADQAFPTQDPQLVFETVAAAHGNVGRLKDLVSSCPELAKATVDWGYGDWESALDGASHIGHREIAQFLIEAGARPTIFSAAMLGQLDVVKAFLMAAPPMARLKGPHGITLMRHAQAGGAQAQAVVEYLATVPGTDERATNVPVAAQDAERISGVYESPALGGELLTVTRQPAQITLARGQRSPRPLMHRGGLEFSPAGATSVRVTFRIAASGVSMTIADGRRTLSATRRL